jgi:hypothetical protein
VEDVEWFVQRVSQAAPKCVIAYCPFGTGDNIALRRQRAWVNHLTEQELVSLMERNGLLFREKGERFMSSQVYVFER